MFLRLLLVAALTFRATTGFNHHRVHKLPGLRSAPAFDHFAGHLQLDTKEKLFYWYTESQDDPERDPIVLWLNGGPGCSSLGGFFTENGPFIVQEDLSVQMNAYSWNRKANVVWVESPAGVGFSHPLQDAEYYNDDVVADRLHNFIRLFFEKYPELQDRDFYITGESYAGIYIPYLVDRLVSEPIEGVKLVGLAIGNPFTDDEIDGNAYMDYYYTHALISRENYHQMIEFCSREIGRCMYSAVNCSQPCQAAINQGIMQSDSDQFNPYNIYGDICLLSNTQAGSLRYTITRHAPKAHAYRGAIGPCTDSFTETYLRQPEVQAAIHVEDGYTTWSDCNDFISANFTRSTSSLPKYRRFLGKGLNILIYSGDADSVVNFIGTERWIGDEGLNLPIKTLWKSWYGPDRQIAGYVQEYEGLTFKTVKGAGHMVPATRPLHGLSMFECFIYGEEKCATFEYPTDEMEEITGATDLHEERATPPHFVSLGTVGKHLSSSNAWLYSAVAAVVVGCGVLYKRSQRRHKYYRGEEIPIASSL